jgi:hypothetical protein
MSEIETTRGALQKFKDQLSGVNAEIASARDAVRSADASYAAAVSSDGGYDAAKKAQDEVNASLGHMQARAAYLEGEVANATVAFERAQRWAEGEFAAAREARAEADKLRAQADATMTFANAKYADAERDLAHAAELGLPEAIRDLARNVK